MKLYENSAITPVCIKCGWHIMGAHSYIDAVGPLCATCYGQSTTKEALTALAAGEEVEP